MELNNNNKTEDGLRLVKLFMQLTDSEKRNELLALAERLVAEQDEKSSGATPIRQ